MGTLFLMRLFSESDLIFITPFESPLTFSLLASPDCTLQELTLGGVSDSSLLFLREFELVTSFIFSFLLMFARDAVFMSSQSLSLRARFTSAEFPLLEIPKTIEFGVLIAAVKAS